MHLNECMCVPIQNKPLSLFRSGQCKLANVASKCQHEDELFNDSFIITTNVNLLSLYYFFHDYAIWEIMM